VHRIGTKAGYTDMDDQYYLGIVGHIDFLEFSMNGGVAPEEFDGHGIPVESIHCAHFDGNGTNFVDITKHDANALELKRARSAADFFRVSRIVIHPERNISESCAVENLVAILREIPDSRYAMENMPDTWFFGTEPGDISNIVRPLGISTCLDVGHAACYAFATGKNFEEYLRELISIGPAQYHFSDNHSQLRSGAWLGDEHLHLGEGSIDYGMVLSLLPPDSFITLETPRDTSGKLRDIEVIRNHEQRS
jgi:deoxyribonuclease-4